MAETSIKAFATQIGVPPDRLLQQLVAAGIAGKGAEDSLTDEEKMTLLGYLRTQHGGEGGSTKITLKHKSVSQIKQATRTGPARTVQVEVRKKRTFVKRSTIEEEVAAAAEAEATAQATGQPLPEEAPLRKLPEPDARGMCGPRQREGGRVALRQPRRPVAPLHARMGIGERHE